MDVDEPREEQGKERYLEYSVGEDNDASYLDCLSQRRFQHCAQSLPHLSLWKAHLRVDGHKRSCHQSNVTNLLHFAGNSSRPHDSITTSDNVGTS